MFASMSMFPDFYKNRMKLFIAIAPAVFLTNMKSKLCQDLAKNEKFISAVKMTGPELLTTAASSNVVTKLIVTSTLGSMVSGKGVSYVTDEDPKCIDPVAYKNYTQFLPAGCCF